MVSALQPWVQNLSIMQQSVLMSSIRGPDGIRKDHCAKLLLRWLRRCILLSAFDGAVLDKPYDTGKPQGGSFTGASVWYGPESVKQVGDNWWPEMNDLVKQYLRRVDELPHHFQLHLMHAAEILGYKHPVANIRNWWLSLYQTLVNDAHLYPESEEQMDWRLCDNEEQWRARESVTAEGPKEEANA